LCVCVCVLKLYSYQYNLPNVVALFTRWLYKWW